MKKPSKPYKTFPLYPHNSGQWAKKIRGRVYYFGVWAKPDESLSNFLAIKDELFSGRTPTAWDPSLLTISDCVNLALNSKEKSMLAGELEPKTYEDYKAVGAEVLRVLGRNRPVSVLRPHDFQTLREELAKGRSVVTLKNLIRRARVLLNWCAKNGYIESTGKLWGTEFTVPAARLLRIKRNEDGPRLVPRERLRQLIEESFGAIKAMIYLGINCAYGPADCGLLSWSDLDFKAGWAMLPRNKTGKTRRAWLWPETIQALGEPSSGLVFRTRYGNPWQASSICHEFQKLRHGVESIGIYWLRHTFLTIAEETRDFEACRAVMGHIDASVTGQYRAGVSDARLMAVSQYVRNWLYNSESASASEFHARAQAAHGDSA